MCAFTRGVRVRACTCATECYPFSHGCSSCLPQLSFVIFNFVVSEMQWKAFFDVLRNADFFSKELHCTSASTLSSCADQPEGNDTLRFGLI